MVPPDAGGVVPVAGGVALPVSAGAVALPPVAGGVAALLPPS